MTSAPFARSATAISKLPFRLTRLRLGEHFSFEPA